MSFAETYHQHGIAFDVPAGWELNEETGAESDTTITLSDGAAFWSLTLMWQRPPVEQVLREAQAAFAEEYGEIDATEVTAKISDRDVEGLDIHFDCLELINSAHLRCLRTGRFTVFIMYQMTDHERDYYQPVFEQIAGSVDLEQDGDVIIE